ncbi:arabinogalactan endo-1,4-beta-galactosidase [Plectosphaerella plurivora]|uniref:Arabinogalactan endo-beta-1,4-galactanase n=1 Tax=Plectosphaerella plurivora TaxID=936078 RepID=A0A9P8V4W1_9PEZI|nr:arabinogalactan endo-1,4-beta-galactosidase [Plectosphaerella plurivora]
MSTSVLGLVTFTFNKFTMLASFASVLLLLSSAADAALNYRGVDWSSTILQERNGIKYSSGGTQQPLERIFTSSGVNSVRQRVWVNPSNGDYNLDWNLQLARRARAQGLSIYLTLHFSDTWADPANQAIPRGWPTDIDNLSWRLYNYTRDISNAFQAAGTPPAIISIGNEITTGLLFPTGSTSSFSNLGRLLRSAAWGIKDSSLNPKPKIMIHLDRGQDWGVQEFFYSRLLASGQFATSDFDMFGVSYYPFYGESATLSSLRNTLGLMASRWGKEIVVAETNWPTSCPSPRFPFPADLRDIPFSAAGQSEFIRRVAGVVSGISRGVGLYYWEPAWMNNQALGSSCDSNTLFSWPGNALSSMSVFGQI